MKQLHNAQEAIKQAKSNEAGENMWFYDSECPAACLDAIMTDPKFWIALGKARGWKSVRVPIDSGEAEAYWENTAEWLVNAHKWLETRLSNGSELDFWSSLP